MSLQEKINNALKEEQEKRKERIRSGKFSPSLLGRCFRAQVLDRANVPQSNPPDERTLRVFRCGKLFHDFVQGYLPDNQCEVKCETDDFYGRADIVTEDTVYDIKSVHSNSFWYAQKDSYNIKEEKKTNWLQLACYGWILKKKKICLVQISKDDLTIGEYVDFTEKWLEPLQAETDELRWHWGNYTTQKVLPSATPRAYNGKEGKYCSHRDYCKGIEDGYKRDTTEHPCFAERKRTIKHKTKKMV